MATRIVDYYSEGNQDSYYVVVGGTNPSAAFQSFTGDGGTLNKATFFIRKNGSPTGSVYAKIYAHTGTFGTDSKPTGSALATSGALDISTLTTSFALKDFTFSGSDKISLSNGTKYCVVIEYSGTYPNTLEVGRDGSSPTHNGNAGYNSFGSWYNSSYDLDFYVYADLTTKTHTIDGGVKATQTKTHTVDGFIEDSESGAPILQEDSFLILQEDGTGKIKDESNLRFPEINYTLDGFVKETFTETFTLDGIVKVRDIEETHTIDGIVKEIQTETHTVDGIVKEIKTKTHTVDGIIKAVNTADHTVDGIIAERNQETFTVDGIIKSTTNNNFTIDGIVQTTETETFTIDGLISDSKKITHTIDGGIKGTLTAESTIDGIIKEIKAKTHTIDGIIITKNEKTHNIDGIVFAQQSKTHTIDGLITDKWGVWTLKIPVYSSWTEKNKVSTIWTEKNGVSTAWTDKSRVSTTWNEENERGSNLLQENGDYILQENDSKIKFTSNIWTEINKP